MKTFVQELKTRRVYRVAIGYVVAAAATVQVVGTVLPIFHAPDWAQQAFIVLIAAGFPIALVFAWCFDVKAGAIEITNGEGGPVPLANQRRLWILAAVSTLIAAGAVGAYWVWHPYVGAPRPAEPILDNVPPKSIAVLPFENLGEQGEYSFLAEGVQDEILTNLAKVADLKVISRTSVMQYKGGIQRNLREIAKALGVAHVLEGSVQRADGRVRVNAQLIDARTDTNIWAEKYDRSLADVFAIESELAEKIVDQLKTRLSPEEKAAIEQQPTGDLAAHDLYVRGKTLIDSSLISLPQQESLEEGIRLLNQAVERDRDFALAYHQLARAHDLLYFVGADHTPGRLALAEAAIRELTRVRPDSGEAHLARATHLYWGYLDYNNAREELRFAQKSLPNDPLPWQLAGYIDRRQSRWEESTKNLEHALELDPQNASILQQLDHSYECLRRYADAAKMLDRMMAVMPKDAAIRTSRAVLELFWHADTRPATSTIQTILGEDSGAAKNIADSWIVVALCQRDKDVAQRALAALPNDGCRKETIPFPRAWCEGVVAQMRGDKAAAKAAFTRTRDAAAKLVEAQPNYPEALCVLGMAEALLGHKQKALHAGRRAVELLPASKDSIGGSLLAQYLALIYAWTGEKDLAIQQLTSAVRTPGYLSYGELRMHPYWDALRGDPRFDQLVASLAPK
jgi:TolB-like protein/Tfp pilus assembly protein PilF